MVKSSLFLVKNYSKKTRGGADVRLRAFLTSALEAGEWTAS